MKRYDAYSSAELSALLADLKKEYEGIKSLGLKLDMSRGKPSAAQLALSKDLLTMALDEDYRSEDGSDVRNYGGLSGIKEARKYFADLLGTDSSRIFVGGSASLQLMFGVLSKAYIWGQKNSPRPWCKEEKIRWLCPVPGYDRHFRITEKLGFEMISVPMTADGPDMDMVEELVKDPAVKGIWCVPKYSNPGGAVYSAETIARFAALEPAAPDFTVMWDNAYCVHEFKGGYVPFPSILKEAEKRGHEDMFFEFASTSKITLPGAGISCMACSPANMEYMLKYIGTEIISYDKVNQLRHVRFLKDKAHTLALMEEHAKIMGPKFALVTETLEKELGGLGVCSWTDPRGGYFVSFSAMPGTAKRIVALMKEAGVVMTGAGAAYPYGKDPEDSNIRIAPSLPPLEELRQAVDVFCLVVKLVSAEKILETK